MADTYPLHGSQLASTKQSTSLFLITFTSYDNTVYEDMSCLICLLLHSFDHVEMVTCIVIDL